MNKNNLKLIMELIFIFILPLVFICFTSEIQVERQFTYDNQGNYETSQDTKNLSFDNSIIRYINDDTYINYLNYNQLNTLNSLFSYDNNNLTVSYNNGLVKIYGTITDTSITDIYLTNLINFNLDNHKYLIYLSQTLPSTYTVRLTGFLTTSNNTFIYPQEVGYNSWNGSIALRSFPYNELIDLEFQLNIIDLTNMFGIGYEPTIIEYESYVNQYNLNYYTLSETIIYYSYSIVSVNNKINYTIWGNIKELLITNLDLNDNVLLDIVLCYTILWIIMWIIWHLFYGLFELLWHVIPSPIERRL